MSRVRVRMDPPEVFGLKVMAKGKEIDRNIQARARRVANLAKMLAPQGKTGHLRSSIRVVRDRVEKGPTAFSYTVIADTDYAIYVHEGTRPHTIRPNTAKALRFEAGGGIVFAKVVHHPGTKAQPFLRNALIAAAG